MSVMTPLPGKQEPQRVSMLRIRREGTATPYFWNTGYSSHRKILHFSLFGVGRKRNGVMAENGTAPRDTLSRSLESKIRLRDTRPHKRTKIYYRLSDIEYISTRNAIMKAGEIVDVGTTAELVKRIEGKVWNCIIPTSKLPECEMRLRIINQRGEDHNQVSIRYLSEHSEIDGAVTTEPRLEDLYLWLFPQTDLEKEDR